MTGPNAPTPEIPPRGGPIILPAPPEKTPVQEPDIVPTPNPGPTRRSTSRSHWNSQ